MAKMKKRTFEREYVQVPNETAKAPEIKNNEKPISLEALGLLVNLWSYNLETWEVHKTELYKRFAFNKETSVKKAWKELIAAGYMIEYKYRIGKKWEYEYIFNILPYTEEQIKIIWEEGREEHEEIWGLDFQDLKMKSSKCSPQNQEISNTGLTQNKSTKEKLKKENIKPIIDDDEKEPFEPNKIAFQYFVNEFNKNFPNHFDNDAYNKIWEQMHLQRLSRFTYKEALNQAKYMNQRIAEGKLNLGDYAAYFVNGIKRKRNSQTSSLLQEKTEKAAKEYKEQPKQEKSNDLPFYNWLEE